MMMHGEVRYGRSAIEIARDIYVKLKSGTMTACAGWYRPEGVHELPVDLPLDCAEQICELLFFAFYHAQIKHGSDNARFIVIRGKMSDPDKYCLQFWSGYAEQDRIAPRSPVLAKSVCKSELIDYYEDNRVFKITKVV